jgi:hypothetical protein
MQHDFNEKFNFSKGEASEDDIQTIFNTLQGCVDVRPAPKSMDLKGVDYIARLGTDTGLMGAQVYIDAKRRERGCSKYWYDEPEVAIEIWSKRPSGKYNVPREQAKIGWTLDVKKETDLVLYTFHPDDCRAAYLLSFQTLRIATFKNFKIWIQLFGSKIQETPNGGNGWESMAVFVPIETVLESMRAVQRYMPNDLFDGGHAA